MGWRYGQGDEVGSRVVESRSVAELRGGPGRSGRESGPGESVELQARESHPSFWVVPFESLNHKVRGHRSFGHRVFNQGKI